MGRPPLPDKGKLLSLRLPDSVLRQLDELSARLPGRPNKQSLIREAIDLYLAQPPTVPAVPAKRKRGA